MHLYLNPHVQPAPGTRAKILEPIVDARIIARVEDAGSVMDLITRKRGSDLRTKPIDEEKWMFTARLPWAEVVTDFHDQLKNATAGYGSLDTREADPPFAEAKLSKVEFMLNGEIVDPLSFVCHKDVAHNQAKSVCEKVRGHCSSSKVARFVLLTSFHLSGQLHEVLPRQQFVTVIQAKADGKIIASARIQAYRKDVRIVITIALTMTSSRSLSDTINAFLVCPCI
jgi:GTP-binding protein LepA